MQELREARERAEFFRSQYAAKEAERKEAAAQLAESRALNKALQAQVGRRAVGAWDPEGTCHMC